jgi:hypothetical protein
MIPINENQPLLNLHRPRPIYEPRNHSKQSYAAQNRAAKKRRNNRQKRK